MIVAPFHASDLCEMRLQPSQAGELVHLDPSALELLAGGLAFTGRIDGRPVACAGIVPSAYGSGAMWAFLAADAGPYMLRLTRAGLRMLEIARLRRVEANVPADFVAGCRWLPILGFELEGLMRKYGPDGSDHYRYARTL
jgi:RimJ/RimL family protein N-acetyltransferase